MDVFGDANSAFDSVIWELQKVLREALLNSD
jgi:hypothetical protein